MERKDIKDKLILKNPMVKETISEFLGTFILIVLGCGCVAQAILSRGQAGGYITINVGFATAIVVAVYVAGGVSGGHINPAVSLTFCVFGRMDWYKLPFYVTAQFLGAFIGSAVLYAVYYDAFMAFAGGKLLVTGENATAQIFATYPAKYLSVGNAFTDQVISTAFLLMALLAFFDEKNLRVPKGLEPVVIGLLIIVLTCSFGLNAGCAMNPARDLSPRLFTAIAGWGFEVFRAGNYYWWIPIVGPLVGGIIGGLIYIVCIELHHSDPDSKKENEQVEEKSEKYEFKVIM